MVVEILIDDNNKVKLVKTELEQNGLFVKPIYNEDKYKVIRTNLQSLTDPRLAPFLEHKHRINDSNLTKEDKTITDFTAGFLRRHGAGAEETLVLLQHLPQKYSLFPPLILFNYSKERSFLHGVWAKYLLADMKKEYFEEMFHTLFRSQNITHAATNMPIIESDIMRRPFNIVPLYGEKFNNVSPAMVNDQLWDTPTTRDFDDALWCHVTQNGIEQFWAPMFTMFSRGNIKEKKRILDVYPDIEGNDVIDMYSGIGYFTLSYLKRGARQVFAFELNPWSTEGLRRGIEANKVAKNRCHIYNESNESCVTRLQDYASKPAVELGTFPTLKIRHINLGLLPTSRPSWALALQCCMFQRTLIPNWDRTTLHIHENIHIDKLDEFSQKTVQSLAIMNPSFRYSATHLERIKTFAPDIWHICLDVDVLYH